MNPLIQALMQALQGRNNPSHPVTGSRQALARAMAARGGKVDPKWNSLAALKPYGESDYADQVNGAANAPQGAFQSDAFQNDAFQVDGVV